jgi:ankyrin repeat protein
VLLLDTGDRLAVAAVAAIRTGDVAALQRLLDEHPGLANARIGEAGKSRTLLHVAADWPGHFPHGADTVRLLVASGAEVDVRTGGPDSETPLHWAASSDDVEVLDALLDAGADIEAPGAVIAGGPPLADARAFGQWNAGRRLIERGAHTTLDDAATFGLLDRLIAYVEADPAPTPGELAAALWGACHGGQQAAASYLLERGADVNWIAPWDGLTPLDAAARSEHPELVEWLRLRGALPADALPS